MATSNKQGTRATALRNAVAVSEVQASAVCGAKSVGGLSREERADAVQDALLACASHPADNPQRYAYTAARNAGLRALATRRRERALAPENGAVFASGKRKSRRQPIELDPEALQQLEKLRTKLVHHVDSLLLDGGEFRTAEIQRRTHAFAWRRIEEAFPGRAPTPRPARRGGGRPRRKLRDDDPANAALLKWIAIRQQRRDAAARFVDGVLREAGFNATEINRAASRIAFDKTIPRKWRARFGQAVPAEPESAALFRGDALPGRSKVFRAPRKPRE
jgi:hypothetical protein